MASRLSQQLSAAQTLSSKLMGGASTNVQDQRPPSMEGMIDKVLQLRCTSPNFFRPSMLMGCKRQNIFHYTHAPSHPQRQNPRMQRILDVVTSTHKVIQDYLADNLEYYFAPEVRSLFELNGAFIRGSCDGVLIRRADGYKFAIEIKTKGHDGYMKMAGPEDGHVDQLTTYLRLTGVLWGVILYWNKDKQYIKEFPVRFEEARWKRIEGRIQELKGYLDRKELPEYDAKTCSPDFCCNQDYCRSKGAPV